MAYGVLGTLVGEGRKSDMAEKIHEIPPGVMMSVRLGDKGLLN